MITDQAVTSATRSETKQSEQTVIRPLDSTPKIVYRWDILITIWLGIFLMSIAGLSLCIFIGSREVAKAIENLKPTMQITQRPTEVKIIHTGLPRVGGRGE